MAGFDAWNVFVCIFEGFKQVKMIWTSQGHYSICLMNGPHELGGRAGVVPCNASKFRLVTAIGKVKAQVNQANILSKSAGGLIEGLVGLLSVHFLNRLPTIRGTPPSVTSFKHYLGIWHFHKSYHIRYM